jgi:hypothetical protein
MDDAPLFATCRFSEFDPSYGIPVRFTLGHPRFKLRYDLAGSWPAAAPDKAFINAPWSEFRDRYYAKLDLTGVDRFRQMARNLGIETLTLNSETDRLDKPIVLLCFEKLWEPGIWCHRTMFGEWWELRTGEDVPEYGRTAHHPAKAATVPPGLW